MYCAFIVEWFLNRQHSNDRSTINHHKTNYLCLLTPVLSSCHLSAALTDSNSAAWISLIVKPLFANRRFQCQPCQPWLWIRTLLLCNLAVCSFVRSFVSKIRLDMASALLDLAENAHPYSNFCWLYLLKVEKALLNQPGEWEVFYL